MAGAITLREFIHKIGFAVSLQGLDEYEKTLQRIDTQTEKMTGGATKLLDRMGEMGKQLSMKLTLPLAGLAGFSIHARAAESSEHRMWGTMLNDMEKGKAFSDTLEKQSMTMQFNEDQVKSYAKELYRLKTPVDQIIPSIRMFADIAAGTGEDAGMLMQALAQSKNLGFVAPLMLRRLLRSGAIDKATLEEMTGARGKDLFKLAAAQKISPEMLEKIFRAEAGVGGKFAGKSKELANELGKNFQNFGLQMKNVQESIGKMLEQVFHLNFLLKAGTKLLQGITAMIDATPMVIKYIVVGAGAFLAILGPTLLALTAIGRAFIFIKNSMVGVNILLTAIKLTTAQISVWGLVRSMSVALAQLSLYVAGFVLLAMIARAIYNYWEAITGLQKTQQWAKEQGEKLERHKDYNAIQAGTYRPTMYTAPAGTLAGAGGSSNNVTVNMSDLKIIVPKGTPQEMAEQIFAGGVVKKAIVTAVKGAIRQ